MKTKKFGILFLILILTLSCNETENNNENWAVYPPGAEVEEYKDIPGLAKVTLYDSKGILVGEGDYLNGQRHGTWVEYEPYTKVVRIMDTYYKGKLHGVSLRINRDGKLTAKRSYYQDQLHGSTLIFENNKVIEEKNYTYGVLEGVSIKYYENGNKMEEANFVNGEMDGLAKWYDREGNLKFQYLYKNGKLVDKNPESD